MQPDIIVINRSLQIPFYEIKLKSLRSGGPGGQHVNKVETAIQLLFDINGSSLPEELKHKILSSKDKRISKEGILVLNCQEFRSQRKNKESAIEKLIDFIRPYTRTRKPRIKTKPTQSAIEKRKRNKTARSKLKSFRKRPEIN